MSKSSNSRSILSMAGSRVLNNSFQEENKITKGVVKVPQNLKSLMIKLTLPRLRKMQALVRGFLVRRRQYPQRLQQYLIAQDLCNLIIMNAMYKQSSQIVIEAITFSKYDFSGEDLAGTNSNKIQNLLFSIILERAVKKDLQEIVQQCLISKALYYSRPQITFGLNMRAPQQLIIYDAILMILRNQSRKIAQESIRQQAQHCRQIILIEKLINDHMLGSIQRQIVNQSLNQNMCEFISERLIDKIVWEGCQVISIVCYEQQKQEKKNKEIKELKKEVINNILQQAILSAILDINF